MTRRSTTIASTLAILLFTFATSTASGAQANSQYPIDDSPPQIGAYNTDDADLVERLETAQPEDRYDVAIDAGKVSDETGLIQFSEPFDYTDDGLPIDGIINAEHALTAEQMVEEGYATQKELDEVKVTSSVNEENSTLQALCNGRPGAGIVNWPYHWNYFGGNRIQCFQAPGGAPYGEPSTLISHVCVNSSMPSGTSARTFYRMGPNYYWSQWRSAPGCYMFDAYNVNHYGSDTQIG